MTVLAKSDRPTGALPVPASANDAVVPAAVVPPAADATLRIVPRIAAVKPMVGTDTQTQLFSAFVDLEVEARSCTTLAALRHAIVNATRKLAPFDQAFLLEPSATPGAWSVTAASSVSSVDSHSPAVRFVAMWASHPKRDARVFGGPPAVRSLIGDAEAMGLPIADCTHPSALIMPMRDRAGGLLAVFMGLRTSPWQSQHAQLVAPLAGAYAHAWMALAPRTASPLTFLLGQLRPRRVALAALAGLALSFVVPVPLTALAPAEVVAADPIVIAAPIDGVVRDILVAPGARVDAGMPIVRFVDTKLRNDAEVAARARLVAEAKYFKVLQTAVATQKDMQDLSIAKAELAVAEAELSYTRDMLARAEIKADRAGVLLYSAKSDLVGKPVAIGERMMEVADPARLELRIDVPIADAIALKPGAEVKLFLDGEPLRPIRAKIERVGYRPITTPDRQLVMRVFASFAEEPPRHIGLRGTARLSGDEVSLAFYLFRRPIAALRQKIGL